MNLEWCVVVLVVVDDLRSDDNTPFDDSRQIVVFGWKCHTKHNTISFFGHFLHIEWNMTVFGSNNQFYLVQKFFFYERAANRFNKIDIFCTL